MTAKVLSEMPFLGKNRKAGDIITDEELAQLTPQVKNSLVALHMLEIDGFSGPAAGMSAADLEALRSLRASFDTHREVTEKQFAELNRKLDAALGKGPKAKRAKAPVAQ